MCPIDFSRSFVKFQGHTGQKNHWFWPELSVSGLQLKFDFTNGFETMHKASNSIAVVPYCFSRSSVKFQGHTGQKILDFDPNWAFPDCNSNLNSSMALKWCTRLDIICFFYVIHQISRSPRLENQQYESHLSKITKPVAAIKSLRFALFCKNCQKSRYDFINSTLWLANLNIRHKNDG